MSKICLAMAFVLSFVTLCVIELNGRITPQHSNETIGDKNWWITISGISKRLLQKPSPSGISEKLYDSEIALNTQESMTYNHKGTFCVDVSTFGEVEYKDVKIEVCDSTFTKQCTDQYKEVCDNVTEIECDIVPFTKCEMIMERVPYNSFNVAEKRFKIKNCSEDVDTIKQVKMVPECKNVTTQNCVTKWKTDPSGNQIWAGNDDCKPLTLRECKLRPQTVDLIVPKIQCKDVGEELYVEYTKIEKTKITSKMQCRVQHASNCRSIRKNKCKGIKYQECEEVQNEKCDEIEVKVPKQIKEHKKKCLFSKENALSASTDTRNGYLSSADTIKITTQATIKTRSDDIGNVSQQIAATPSISSYGGHMEAPLFPFAAPIIPRAPFNSNNGINGRLIKNKGRRPKRKTFKKEMKYLAHVPKIIPR